MTTASSTVDSPRIRLAVMGIVAISLFAALVARLWYLQVIGTEEYQLAAEVQNTREIAIEAPRGRILDAQGRVLVDNRISIVVTLDPQELAEVDDREATLVHLADTLTRHGHPTKVADLEDRLADPEYNPVEPRPVAVDVSEEFEVYLIERRGEFPAVDVRREAVRVYPYGQLAAHILGYVGRITEDEYTAVMGTEEEPIEQAKPYERDDSIGKTGVERVFERHLRGTPGVETIQVDARGEPMRTLEYSPPVPGNDLQLTIDIDVQALSEDALREGLITARTLEPQGDNPPAQAPAGAIVVEDPRNGSIIAMASYPTYDPSEFVGGISAERYNELLGDEAVDDPFTNRAIAGQYPVGSTFKLITGFAALRDGLIAPGSYYTDDRVYTAIGCTAGVQCEFSSPEGAGGSYNIESAIRDSSDTFFYRLGDRYWVEEGRNPTGIQDAAEDLGLHHATGVQLPFEASGFIPTAERKAERHEENPDAFPFGEWYSGDNINLSIGQGDVLVTPIQMTNVYATFANRGTLHQPNIAARLLEPGGDPANPADVIREFAPRVAHEVDMPPEIWDPMHRGFSAVTVSGTAATPFAGWDHARWPVAGKTGTVEVGSDTDVKADNAVFIGYGGPAGQPSQYVVSVFLEQAGFAAQAAAPVARWVFEPLAGVVPMPPARTVEEIATVPEEQCNDEESVEGGATTSTSTTSTTISNPLVDEPCPTEPAAGGDE
jgi:penicillin-binding protein 2